MLEVELRKRVIVVEEIFHEGGPMATKPLRRAAALVVIRNPFAGKYVEAIAGFMEDLNPLGVEMAKALVAALGGDAKVVEGHAVFDRGVALLFDLAARPLDRSPGQLHCRAVFRGAHGEGDQGVQ